jgi:hypothetical protein
MLLAEVLMKIMSAVTEAREDQIICDLVQNLESLHSGLQDLLLFICSFFHCTL